MAIGCYDIVETLDGHETFVVFQSDFLSHLDTRLVIPLIQSELGGRETLRLNPTITVEDTEFVLATHLSVALRICGLRRTGQSIADEHHRIRDAFDFLTGGF